MTDGLERGPYTRVAFSAAAARPEGPGGGSGEREILVEYAR